MMAKLASRKFWAMIGAILISLFAGDTIDSQQFIGTIVSIAAYILGQSYVDGKAASIPK